MPEPARHYPLKLHMCAMAGAAFIFFAALPCGLGQNSEPGDARAENLQPHVSYDVLGPNGLKVKQQVDPVYPPLAQMARIQGVVSIDASVKEDGTVSSVKVVSGHPLLAKPAIEAIQKWRFEPYPGLPAHVAINMDFRLTGKDLAPSTRVSPRSPATTIESIDIRGPCDPCYHAPLMDGIPILVGDVYDPAKVALAAEMIKAKGNFTDVRVETRDSVPSANSRMIIFYVSKEGAGATSTEDDLPATEASYQDASRLLRAGELEDAQREFATVLQTQPNYRNARVLLGLALARLSEQSEKLAEASLAADQLRQALTQDPDEAYWHSALARLLHAQGKVEDAAKECAQAAKLSPDDFDLAHGCGFGTIPELAKDDSIPALKDLSGATEPIPIIKPDPPYTDKAQAAVYQADLTVCTVIGADGAVEHVAVEKPAGLGLDESALRSILHWKFKPATLNGVPLRVRVHVEVSFRSF